MSISGSRELSTRYCLHHLFERYSITLPTFSRPACPDEPAITSRRLRAGLRDHLPCFLLVEQVLTGAPYLLLQRETERRCIG